MKLPPFEIFASEQLSKKMYPQQSSNTTNFDPCDLMVKKKNGEEKLSEIQKYPEEDVKALEDYCKKMGIMGFSSRMHPKIVLQMLKQRNGDYSSVSVEERVPSVYQKVNVDKTIKKDLLCG